MDGKAGQDALLTSKRYPDFKQESKNNFEKNVPDEKQD